MNEFNIYCDESCHLENDNQKVMVLGAITCSKNNTRIIAEEVRDIKETYGLSRHFEIKWTKISPAKLSFYLALIDYFYQNSDLSFRAIVIPDKNNLKHDQFNQTHDEWYYKMYYSMLKTIITSENNYNIYIDIKDTQGGQKIDKLHDVLSNNIHDFSKKIIQKIQQVRSHEMEQLQLTDLLIGALKTANLKECNSSAKHDIIEKIKLKSGCHLTQSTPPSEKKTNIFIWRSNNSGGYNV